MAFLLIWFLIVLVTVSFGLVNTLFMAIFERTREIGLFQALGMRPSSIVWQVLCESMILLTLGAVLGNLLAFGTVDLFHDGINLSKFGDATEYAQMSKMVYLVILERDLVIGKYHGGCVGGSQVVFIQRGERRGWCQLKQLQGSRGHL